MTMRPTCACGAPAILAADVFREGGTRPARLLLCSPLCATVRHPGTKLDIFLEGRDFVAVLSDIRPCWCPSAAHPSVSPIAPFCPRHGHRRIAP